MFYITECFLVLKLLFWLLTQFVFLFQGHVCIYISAEFSSSHGKKDSTPIGRLFQGIVEIFAYFCYSSRGKTAAPNLEIFSHQKVAKFSTPFCGTQPYKRAPKLNHDTNLFLSFSSSNSRGIVLICVHGLVTMVWWPNGICPQKWTIPNLKLHQKHIYPFQAIDYRYQWYTMILHFSSINCIADPKPN